MLVARRSSRNFLLISKSFTGASLSPRFLSEKPAVATEGSKIPQQKKDGEAVTSADSLKIEHKTVNINKEKVEQLADQVLSLNLIELLLFSKQIETKLGLPDLKLLAANRMAAAPAAPASAPTPQAAPAAKPEETKQAPPAKTVFELKLESYGAADKIKVIKLVREITGLGLKEAKEKVEAVPQVILKDLNKEQGDQWIEKFKAAGAKTALV